MNTLLNKKQQVLIKLAIFILYFLVSGECLQNLSGQDQLNAKLKFMVRDDAGQPIAFRIQVFDRGRQIFQSWERSMVEVSIPEGRHIILIRHGFDYDAVLIDTIVMPSAIIEKTITLRKRYDIRNLGWYCGESHMHGQHDSTNQPQTFKDAARLAEANGLDYIQIAQWWTADFKWTRLEILQEMAREATTSLVNVNWNLESPKCYMGPDDGGRAGNLHCYGHGCTLGLKERPYDRSFWFTGPNFRIIQEIHRQHAVVMLAHPVRFWFNNGNFVSNMASEIAFDYIAGQGYDGVDIFNDGESVFFQHERVWWNLLNMGYKVSGTANSDGSIINGQAGRYRTYTKINGAFSWEKIAEGIRNGVCIASSGPMVIFQVDGRDPGAEFLADGKVHHGFLQIWSSPLPGEMLVSAQIIRNGEIVQAWDLRSKQTRQWSCDFELSDNNFAWYAIRVISTSRDPELQATWSQSTDIYEVAVANPVYFIPDGFHRPIPAEATVKINITDEADHPLAAKISVMDLGKEIAQHSVDASGIALFNAPATSYLVINAQGFKEARKDIYMDSPIYNYCRDFTGFYTPEAYDILRELLANLSLHVKLKRNSDTQLIIPR